MEESCTFKKIVGEKCEEKASSQMEDHVFHSEKPQNEILNDFEEIHLEFSF